jgi:phosphinothricin acetyltransferase
MTDVRIRPATSTDAEAIAAIYNHYVRETTVTFEEQEVTAAEMASRLADVAAARLPWLVAEAADGVVGYGYATKWRVRAAYRYSVETSIYLAPAMTGRGIGRALYDPLLDVLRERSIHTAIGGIALPNAASIALHERLGFVKVAHLGEVGFKFGRWIDVGYWQRRP